MRVEPRPDSGPCFFATRHITFSAQQPFPFQSMLRRPPCVCLTPAIIHVNKCLLTLFSRLFAKMHPPPLPCSLSQSTVSSICRWRVSSNSFVNLARCFFFFSSFCPETIPGRVVGGLYTGNGAELLDFCFKKKNKKQKNTC